MKTDNYILDNLLNTLRELKPADLENDAHIHLAAAIGQQVYVRPQSEVALEAKLSKTEGNQECLRQIHILATRKNRGSTLAKDLLLDLNKIATLVAWAEEEA